MTTVQRWHDVLDAMERSANECARRYLDHDDIGTPRFAVIPDDLGQMPLELTTRASTVLARVEAVAAMMQRVRRPSAEAAGRRFRADPAPRSATFDHQI